MRLALKARVWVYPGDAAWHFVTIDRSLSDGIREHVKERRRRGFGAVRVRAMLGKSEWETSIFPVKGDGTYLLPLKLSVRKAEGIMEQDIVKLTLDIP